jgi:hypothetical protein
MTNTIRNVYLPFCKEDVKQDSSVTEFTQSTKPLTNLKAVFLPGQQKLQQIGVLLILFSVVKIIIIVIKIIITSQARQLICKDRYCQQSTD